MRKPAGNAGVAGGTGTEEAAGRCRKCGKPQELGEVLRVGSNKRKYGKMQIALMRRRRKDAEVTVETAKEHTKKQITAVLIIGMALLLVDFIAASSNTPKVENSYGQLYITRPEAGGSSGSLSLKARISGENGSYEKKVNVMLEPYQEKQQEKQGTADQEESIAMTEEERFDYELRTVVDGLNGDRSVRKVCLPKSLGTGEQVTWQIEEHTGTNTIPIAALIVLLVFALYKNRFAAIKKRKTEQRESVMRQLPEFVNRLVLLLNAGMVLNGAFEKSIAESLHFNKAADDYFYKKLKDIYGSVKTANGSVNAEFRRFAKESGIKELIRISNIINDNINKGTELTHKLQSESELLWLNRKKRCEEKGKLAETKLTLPLVIFLMVLIVITVAPALLEL